MVRDMRLWSLPVTTCTLCLSLSLASVARAQSDDDDDPTASPDVQAQVGMGTEKEEDDDSPQDSDSEADVASAPQSDEQAAAPTYGHAWQFGLRSAVSFGYKIMFRYDDSPPCDVGAVDDRSVCGFGTPPALDLALSFALLDSIEPYVWLRFGLADQTQTATAATSLLGAGVRIYTMSDSQLKLFFEPALAVETEERLGNGPVNANYDTDYLVHLHFGLQYDFMKYFGLYGSVGPNVTFVRAIGTELEASIGIQGRAP